MPPDAGLDRRAGRVNADEIRAVISTSSGLRRPPGPPSRTTATDFLTSAAESQLIIAPSAYCPAIRSIIGFSAPTWMGMGVCGGRLNRKPVTVKVSPSKVTRSPLNALAQEGQHFSYPDCRADKLAAVPELNNRLRARADTQTKPVRGEFGQAPPRSWLR